MYLCACAVHLIHCQASQVFVYVCAIFPFRLNSIFFGLELEQHPSLVWIMSNRVRFVQVDTYAKCVYIGIHQSWSLIDSMNQNQFKCKYVFDFCNFDKEKNPYHWMFGIETVTKLRVTRKKRRIEEREKKKKRQMLI